MDRGAWQATVQGVAGSGMTEHVHVRAHTHTHTRSNGLYVEKKIRKTPVS